MMEQKAITPLLEVSGGQEWHAYQAHSSNSWMESVDKISSSVSVSEGACWWQKYCLLIWVVYSFALIVPLTGNVLSACPLDRGNSSGFIQTEHRRANAGSSYWPTMVTIPREKACHLMNYWGMLHRFREYSSGLGCVQWPMHILCPSMKSNCHFRWETRDLKYYE